MIKSHFEELRQKKATAEQRKLPIRTIATETGLAPGTVQRIKQGTHGRVYFSTLDALCCYFGVNSISELIEYSPDGSGFKGVVVSSVG